MLRRATWIVWAVMAAGACGGDPVFQRPTTATSDGPIALREGQTVGGPARHLTVEDGPRFSGLALLWFRGACSGSFVVPAGLDLDADGPAYVLTAAHCLELPPPNSVDVNVTRDARQPALFHYFGDSAKSAVEVPTGLVAFLTMKGVDLAIVELQATRHQLRDEGVVPFVLSDAPVADGAEIAFAGHPLITNDGFAVLSACHQLRRPPLLLESDWHWFDVVTHACRMAETGSSGSPVFSLSSGRVVAVHNTGVDPTFQPPYPCDINQPCEAGPDTIRFVPETSYSIPVDGLGACFDATGRFDPTGAGCPLDRDVQMQTTVSRIVLASAPGATLTAKVPLDPAGLTHYRTAIGPAATTDCRSAASYGPVTAHAAAPEIEATIPGDPGHYVVCVQAGPGPDPAAAGWQDLRTPTIVIANIVNAGPAR